MTVEPGATLTVRALNRAVLARQLLLERSSLPVGEAIDAVAALQAQHPRSPFLGLRARLAGFGRATLDAACVDGSVVKASLMRGTLHLVAARSYPYYATVSHLAVGRLRARWAPGVDWAAFTADLVEFADGQARSVEEIGEFAERWTKENCGTQAAEALAGLRGAHNFHPVRSIGWLVQSPASAAWDHSGIGLYQSGRSAFRDQPGIPTMTPAPDGERAWAEVARRYLAASGPASAADLSYWVGEARRSVAAAALRDLGDELVVFRDEAGRDLYDLPGAPRPDPGTPAPVRFLPRWDGLLLGHAPDGRHRVIADEYRPAVYRNVNGMVLATFLADGQVAGTWDVTARRTRITMRLAPLRRLTKVTRKEVMAEAENVLEFLAPELPEARESATREIVVD